MAFTQLQLDDSMPTYCIMRDAVEPTNLIFMPPKGSDELFDALRDAFPGWRTHSDRMRQAVLAFLLEEQTALEASPVSTWPAAPSVLSSPDSNNLPTPASFAPSPQVQDISLTRQASTATNASQSSPPALDQMTSVFSLSTAHQPKQRIRRKMTEAEKVEYRKRRIVKACDKCAKRKRKCPHNQAQMETLTSSTASKASSKVSKSVSPKSSKSPSAQTQQQSVFDATAPMGDLDFDNFLNAEYSGDFALYPDQDTFADMDLDSFLDPTLNYSDIFTPDVSPTQQDWQYSDVQNANANQYLDDLDIFDHAAYDSGSSSSPDLHSSNGRLGHHLPQQSGQSAQPDMFSSWDSLTSINSYEQQPALRSNATQTNGTGEDSNGNGIQQNGTATSEVNANMEQNSGGKQVASGICKKRSVDSSGGSGDDLSLDHFAGQLEKPVPTHTVHVHEAQSRQLSSLDESTTALQETRSRPTQLNQQALPRTSIHPSAVQARVSIEKQHVSHGGRYSSEWSTASHASHDDQRGSRISTLQRERGSQSMLSIARNSQQQQPRNFVQDLTSTSVSVSGGLTSAAPQGRPLSSEDERNVERQATRQQQALHTQSMQQGASSLGQGLSQTADPSSQLYMARKRAMGRSMTRSGLQLHTPLGLTPLQRQLLTANCGAYPRLQTQDSGGSVLLAAEAARIANVQQHGAANGLFAGQDRLVVHAAAQDLSGAQDVHESRLRDTNRHKDHHGRASLSSYLLAMFGCALLLAASLLSSSLSSTALLLAFTIPCQETPQTSSLEKIVHCTTKNSRWLSSAFASLTETKFGLAIPSREKQGWYFPGTEGSWLRGMLSPSARACC